MSHHGNTPAAWTGVGVSSIGVVLGGIAMLMDPIRTTLLIIGLAIMVIGFPVWMVMEKMGLGEH